MVAIFITLSYVLVDGGFSSALIQKKDADILDYSSVFYFTLGFSLIIYLILFFCAPFISEFYDNKYPQLSSVLRILGLQIIIYGINSIQIAYVSARMMFKNLFWSSLIGTSISAVIGLIMALNGYGVWAIVCQQLTNTSINTITLYLITRKTPAFMFSYERLKKLLNFGVKLFGSSIIITIFQELRAIIIGKLYSAKDLALFDRGRQFPSLIVTNINTSIGAVLFPVMAKKQDSLSEIKSITRKSIKFSAFVMAPLMIILASCSESFVLLILTEKWIGCVPLMQWFCIVFLFQPIHTANLQALKAIGRSDICLKLEIIKKIIELVTLLMVMYISVKAIVINMAVLTTFFTLVNAYPNRKILNYSYAEQTRDVCLPIIIAVASSAPTWIINSFIQLNPLASVVGYSSLSLGLYLILSKFINSKELDYVVSLVKKSNGTKK